MNEIPFEGWADRETAAMLEKAVELLAPPKRWMLDLVTGDWLTVLGHEYAIVGNSYEFRLWFRGNPDFSVTSAMIPANLVFSGFGELGEGVPVEELSDRTNRTLLSFAAELWRLDLTVGGSVHTIAHCAGFEGERYEHSLMFEDRPVCLVTSLSIAASLRREPPPPSAWRRMKIRFREKFNF